MPFKHHKRYVKGIPVLWSDLVFIHVIVLYDSSTEFHRSGHNTLPELDLIPKILLLQWITINCTGVIIQSQCDDAIFRNLMFEQILFEQ